MCLFTYWDSAKVETVCNSVFNHNLPVFDEVFCIGDLKDIKSKVVRIKEGSSYKLKIDFRVSNCLLCGTVLPSSAQLSGLEHEICISIINRKDWNFYLVDLFLRFRKRNRSVACNTLTTASVLCAFSWAAKWPKLYP